MTKPVLRSAGFFCWAVVGGLGFAIAFGSCAPRQGEGVAGIFVTKSSSGLRLPAESFRKPQPPPPLRARHWPGGRAQSAAVVCTTLAYAHALRRSRFIGEPAAAGKTVAGTRSPMNRLLHCFALLCATALHPATSGVEGTRRLPFSERLRKEAKAGRGLSDENGSRRGRLPQGARASAMAKPSRRPEAHEEQEKAGGARRRPFLRASPMNRLLHRERERTWGLVPCGCRPSLCREGRFGQPDDEHQSDEHVTQQMEDLVE